MKHVTTHKRAFRFAALLGLTTLFGSLTALAPANAQDWRNRRDHVDARYDAATLRREQDHLHDLQRRRDDAKRHHDRDAVRRLNVAIRDTQWRIDNKRFDVHHDYDSFYTDRDRDWFRNHNH